MFLHGIGDADLNIWILKVDIPLETDVATLVFLLSRIGIPNGDQVLFFGLLRTAAVTSTSFVCGAFPFKGSANWELISTWPKTTLVLSYRLFSRR